MSKLFHFTSLDDLANYLDSKRVERLTEAYCAKKIRDKHALLSEALGMNFVISVIRNAEIIDDRIM
jgi:hypothetical protein